MGCIRVPAMRLAMASSSVGLVKTLTSAAREKSGRLTCMPLRRRPASCVVDGDGGHLGQQGARDGEGGARSLRESREGLQFVDSDGLGQGKGAGLGAAQRGEMRSAAGELAEFVRDGADVAAGGDLHLKAGCHLCGRGPSSESSRSDG